MQSSIAFMYALLKDRGSLQQAGITQVGCCPLAASYKLLIRCNGPLSACMEKLGIAFLFWNSRY